MTSCSGDDATCETTCEADCGNRCAISCQATPPSVSCDDQCVASCQGSCNVQANVGCEVGPQGCWVNTTGGCTAACSAPEGALFCSGQYIDVTEAASCVACLETNGLSFSTTTTCIAGKGCTTSLSACAATSAVGSSEERWGVFGITGLVMGFGLMISRRRKNPAPTRVR
jgi:hypothetical protein